MKKFILRSVFSFSAVLGFALGIAAYCGDSAWADAPSGQEESSTGKKAKDKKISGEKPRMLGARKMRMVTGRKMNFLSSGKINMKSAELGFSSSGVSRSPAVVGEQDVSYHYDADGKRIEREVTRINNKYYLETDTTYDLKGNVIERKSTAGISVPF